MPGLSRSPQAIPPARGLKRSSCPIELKMILSRVCDGLVDFVIGPGHAVGMGFAAETRPPELDFVQRRRGGAVHVRPHEVEDGPGRETLQGEQCLRAGLLSQVGDPLQVAEQFRLVDKIIGRVHHDLLLSLATTLEKGSVTSRPRILRFMDRAASDTLTEAFMA